MLHWRLLWLVGYSLVSSVLVVGCGSSPNSTSITESTVEIPATAVVAEIPTTAVVAEIPTKPAVAVPTSKPAIATPVPLQPSPEAVTHAPTARPIAEGNGLRRRTAPPSGVAAQISFGGGGGGGFFCGALPDPSLGLRMTIYQTDHDVADGFSICFSGFVNDQPIDVEVTRPDGSVQRVQVPADPKYGPESLDWVTWPGDPLGEYAITAQQGNEQTSGRFMVHQASQPRVVVFPVRGAPGTVFQIALAGYEPNQDVPIHVYKFKPPFEGEYFTSFLTKVNSAGEAIYPLQTQPEDSGHFYVLPESVDPLLVFGLNQLIVEQAIPTNNSGAQTIDSEATSIGTELWEGTGMLITGVDPGSVAESAGFRVGQILLNLNGEPIEAVDTARDIFNSHRGEEVIATVQNANGQSEQLIVVPPASGPVGLDLCESGRCPRPE